MNIVFTIIYTVVVLCVAVVLCSIGRTISQGKGDNLIAGYNTASAEEKKKYDIKRLRILISVTLYIFTFLMFPIILMPFIPERYAAYAILAWSAIVCILVVVVITMCNRWAKKK